MSPGSKELKSEREALFAAAGRHTPILAARSPEAVYLTSTADQTIGRSMVIAGTRGEMRVLERVVAAITSAGQGSRLKGSTFLDVGANIGTTTLTALLKYDFADAVACEPAPENFRLLGANLILNGLEERARVLPVAASDEIGVADLRISSVNSGAHKISAAGPRPNTVTIRVQTTTLDELARRGLLKVDQVGLIWIDTQGHEPHVLAGATQLTAAGVPVLLEYLPNVLEKHGERENLHAIARENYTHFIDMRFATGTTDAELIPIEKIGGDEDLDSRAVTDLLLLRTG